MKGPSAALALLDKFVSVEMAPKKYSVILAEIIITERRVTTAEAQELATKWADRFRDLLQRKLAAESENTQVSLIEFNPANDEYIQGSCYISPKCAALEAEAKRLRANRFKYVEEFHKLTDTEFEILCSRILSLWQVEEDFVTRQSADQGVDFYGRVPFGEIMKTSAIGNGAEKQLKIWLVGQAKNYSASQVSTKDIRELVGSVSLARSKTYAGAKDPLAKLEMRTCDPVFFLFFTTGRLSRDAWDLLKKAGVVAMDGSQLSVFLADHGIGLIDGKFDAGAFRIWAKI